MYQPLKSQSQWFIQEKKQKCQLSLLSEIRQNYMAQISKQQIYNMQQKSKPLTVPVPLRSIVSILLFQFVFYGVVFAIAYWLLTLNIQMLLISLLISILQLPIRKRSQAYCNFVLNVLRPQQYFYIERFYEEPVSDYEKTMFAYHPHSIFAYGVLCNLNRQKFPNEKLSFAAALGSRFMLALPIIGLHFRFWGVQSVDPTNLKKLMSEGKNISLVPGGYEQATITTPQQFRVFIKSRKGFIKYALKYGYTIRPIIITNQHKAMCTFDGLLNWRLLLNKIKIPGVIYWRRYGIFFPPGIHMHTIIGKGVKAKKVYLEKEEPSKEEIDVMHGEYVQEIERIYEKHKAKNSNTPLKIY